MQCEHPCSGGRPGNGDDPAAAAQYYLGIVEENPRDPGAHCRLGLALKDLGLLDEAISCFREALRLDPGLAAAHAGMGVVLHIQGRAGEAAAAFRRAREHGDTTPSNLHIINALTGRRTDRPPPGYAAHLFDSYAPRFDESLVRMGYETPMLLRRELDLLDASRTFSRGLDLGCGTGFSGLPFRDRAEHLTGVDVSAGMLARAAEKEIYDELHCCDLLSFLEADGEGYDLAVMADVCVYLGRLDPVFAALCRRLRPAACLLVSIEHGSGDDFVLKPSGRYGHSPAYVERLARTAGMRVARRRSAVIRRDGGKDVMGELMVIVAPGP